MNLPVAGSGFVWHERFMWHDGGRLAGLMPAVYPVEPGQSYETAETKRRLKNLLDACGASDHLVPTAARAASDDELLRVHTPGYLKRLHELDGQHQADAGLDGHLTRGSLAIARLAAGGCLSATDAILDGQIQNAYALARPIGHHAEPDAGMGFCLLANPSLAVHHALARSDINRVAVVDIDVHHGNGAQKVFFHDSRVLTISIHQDRWFPSDTGHLSERGAAEGFGCNINIPLPAGSGRGAYLDAFERVVRPALAQFSPQFIIMPCGYDALAQDPLGRMILNGGAYRDMTLSVMEAAASTADGRLLVTHEGGYNPWTVPFAGLAVIESLTGLDFEVTDPYEPIFAAMHGHALLEHQRDVIDSAAAFVDEIRKPDSADHTPVQIGPNPENV